jgi:C4-dicarboxylate-specific signal transduction histidine kinase
VHPIRKEVVWKMSPEATVGLYLTFAAGILALIGMLALQFVVSYLRRRQKERRVIVSYLRRCEKEQRRGMEQPTFRGTRAGSGVLEEPSSRRAYREGTARRRSKAEELVDPEARTAELRQEQLEEARREASLR